jgi:hypothetical protein
MITLTSGWKLTITATLASGAASRPFHGVTAS